VLPSSASADLSVIPVPSTALECFIFGTLRAVRVSETPCVFAEKGSGRKQVGSKVFSEYDAEVLLLQMGLLLFLFLSQLGSQAMRQIMLMASASTQVNHVFCCAKLQKTA